MTTLKALTRLLRPQWRTRLLGFCLCGATTAPAHAAPPNPSVVWPPPPFEAWVAPQGAYLRSEPQLPSRLLGLLRRGDTVVVRACLPDCNAPHAWALLEPRGALRTAELKPLPVSPGGAVSGASGSYVYARIAARTPLFSKPDARSRILRHERAEFRLAFAPDAALARSGWYQRPFGGFMRAKDLKFFTPSAFVGEHELQPPFAFVRRKVKVTPPKGAQVAEPVWLQRYERLPVLGEVGSKVLLPGGSVPRALVRIVRFHGPGAHNSLRRVHVDLREQVLSAYEGNRLVFATLVSTGKEANKTKSGSFRIFAKTMHSSMRGRPWDDYYAEEIPYVMHFYQGQALHGTYWHDQFGIEKSHGCINLSLADAKWLFEWVTPPLPTGWHSIFPGNHDPAVWLSIDKGGKAPRRHSPALTGDPSPPPNTCLVDTAMAPVCDR